MTVITRFAPSPTGNLQLGNIRTALIAYLFARNQGGKFMLRIDDTDLERSKDEYTQSIKADLSWLGMSWDDYRHQLGREDVYDAARDKLLASGRLYPCYETEDELALKRKSALGRGLPPIYDRAALKLTDEQKRAYEAEGRKPHYRFLLEHKPIIWQDLVRGKVEFHGKDMSDPVLIREDGTALYHLGSVVDDIEYGMTHIVRGEDHVSNTACHVQMFEALGATPPVFAHLPLVFDADGKKLSKRIGSLSIATLRDEEGLEPMTVASFQARLGTSDPIEAFADMDALIAQFDINRFSRSNPRFMDEELYRLNAKILHNMDYAQAKPRLDAMGLSDLDEAFWNIARANISRFKDIAQWWQVAKGPVTPVIEDAEFAQQALDLLPSAPWDNTTWNTWVSALKEQTGRNGKLLFMPLRQALTGMNHGPEMPNLLPLIGPEQAQARLKGKAA
jgi:glutamyl-tRNA synthetase